MKKIGQIVAVFHGKKIEGVLDYQAAVAANPTLTMEGLDAIQGGLLPKIKALGKKFKALFCSRMARALDTASVLAMDLDLDICTVAGLGQAANLDKGTVVAYPGHEADDVLTWQRDVKGALEHIHCEMVYDIAMSPDYNVLVVSHRPVIAAMVALAQGITDAAGIQAVLDDPTLTKDGYIVFNYDGETLTLA
jgi:broad specificity phosphatase PhoE